MTEKQPSKEHLDCMERWTDLVGRQMKESGGRAISFDLPTPQSDIEREAMRFFVKELEIASGRKIKIIHHDQKGSA